MSQVIPAGLGTGTIETGFLPEQKTYQSQSGLDEPFDQRHKIGNLNLIRNRFLASELGEKLIGQVQAARLFR
jgi:hypothetical protein